VSTVILNRKDTVNLQKQYFGVKASNRTWNRALDVVHHDRMSEVTFLNFPSKRSRVNGLTVTGF
jgi:hypothetical protein